MGKQIKFRKPRRLTPDIVRELISLHSSCVNDQVGKCPLLISVSSLTWELNQVVGVTNAEDRGFKRHDETCAARPLNKERFDDKR